MSTEPMVSLLLAAVGLVMGSAVSALAHRLPRQRSWMRGRSACPRCGTSLAPRDLVPVLSFALNRGRCRHCGECIAWRYPLTEPSCAAWAVLLFRHVGLGWTYPFLALWGFLLIALVWIDLDFQLFLDSLTFPGTLLAANSNDAFCARVAHLTSPQTNSRSSQRVAHAGAMSFEVNSRGHENPR